MTASQQTVLAIIICSALWIPIPSGNGEARPALPWATDTWHQYTFEHNGRSIGVLQFRIKPVKARGQPGFLVEEKLDLKQGDARQWGEGTLYTDQTGRPHYYRKTLTTHFPSLPAHSGAFKMEYNFGRDDFFGHAKESPERTVQIAVLNEENRPVEFMDGEKETAEFDVKGIDPEKYIGSKSEVQKKTLRLKSPPKTDKDWPVTLVVKDNQGAEIDRFSSQVTFKMEKPKKS